MIPACSSSNFQTKESGNKQATVNVQVHAFAQSPYPKLATETLQPRSYEWKADTVWADSVFNKMTLAEEVGQMIVPFTWTSYYSSDDPSYQTLIHFVRDLKVGGFVVSIGDIYEQAILLNRLQSVADIPLLISADYENGLGMRLKEAPAFPTNMAFGAAGDSLLVYKVGNAIAREARAIGVTQNYAPVSDVNDNPENPIINVRSYGEDPNLVAKLASAFIKGTQDAGVIATAKHFPGHGNTSVDSHAELPVLNSTYEQLDKVELVPFRADVKAGVKSVMVAHIAFESFEGQNQIPGSLSHKITTDLLQDSVHFHGLIVTDALNMKGVTNKYSVAEAAVRAVKAGADILLMPPDIEVALNALVRAVQRGEISKERIDYSVKKILLLKSELGLNKNKFVNIDDISDIVGIQAHKLLAEKAARRSITIIKNEDNILPLQYFQNKKVLCITVSDNCDPTTGALFSQELSSRYHNVNFQQVNPASNKLDFDSLLVLAKESDIVIIPAYVKVRAGKGTVDFPDNIRDFLTNIANLKKPTVLISFGNPYILRSSPNVSAYVCAYGDQPCSITAAVQAIFSESPVSGKLPISISDSIRIGSGLELPQTSLRYAEPIEAGFSPVRLARLDSIVNYWIADSAFPGAQLLVAKDGKVVYNKAFGTYDYSPYSRSVDLNTMYDLASVTKVVATTLAAMKLYGEGKLDINAPVVKYIPQFGQNGKQNILVRNLLEHNSGLPPDPSHYLWYTKAISQTELDTLLKHPSMFITANLDSAHSAMWDTLYATPLVYPTGTKMVYSDIGMLIVGKIIEKITGMPLSDYVTKNFYKPLGMIHTMFTPPSQLAQFCAPTEYDSISGKLLQGVVHDENARSLGGAVGHAGLFSNSSDLAVYLQMLLNGGVYDGRRYLEDSVIALFTKRQSELSTRGLGWDTKSPEHSSAGHYFSATSFGHLGFTGTSVWVDPVRKLFVVFLTNRVCPTRNNQKIAIVRPAIHDAVIEALKN